MDAIILAAGRGSRMGQNTDASPKCLTVLAGKTLLAWQRAALTAAGLDRIAVVTGYLAETLQAPDLTTFHNPRWSETNMVMSLTAAAPWLRRATCLVSYSDIVYAPDIPRALMATPGEIVISHDRNWLPLWSARFEDPLSDAESFQCDAAGRLLEIGRRQSKLDQIQGQYMGLLKITPTGWAAIEELLAGLPPADRDELDMTGLLRRLLGSREIKTCPIEGRWCEVDSGQDLQLYQSKIQAGADWSHDWRW